MNKLITEKKIINKINRDQDSYRINRDILRSHEFDKARSSASLSNASFNNSLSSILPSLTIETPSPAATFNITERPTATGTLLINTPRNLSHPTTACPTNEAIDNMLKTIECNNIRGHIVSEIRKEIEPIKVLKEKLHWRNKIINTLLEIIGKFGNDKRDTQPVPLINFENDLTTSPNKLTDSETDPKLDEQQQSHNNKKKISSKDLGENSKEKGGTKSILFNNSVTLPKQSHKQQSLDDKQKSCSKRLCENSKGKRSNTTTNASKEEQLHEFKRKKKEEYCKYKQNVYSDPDEKDKSVNNDQ